MSTKTITCPSGLVGEIRNLKAKELSILADPANAQAIRAGKKAKVAKRAHPLDPLYAGCWLRTLDPGPYAIAEGSAVPWPKILTCDRFFTLVHIRDLTWGTYDFKVKCSDTTCPRHKKPFVWDIDLNQLEFKELPQASRERVKAGNLVFDITVGGKKCKFKLLVGEDEANMPTLSDDVPTHKKLLAQVATRIFEVEGVEDEEERIEWVGELDAPELFAASKAMDAVDGGIETRTVVVCPECDQEMTIDIPFGDAGFLAPTPK